MFLSDRFAKAHEREKIIAAVRSFDTEALKALISNGADIKRLGHDKKLAWHVQRKYFPEAYSLENLSSDEREQVQNISERLAKGSEILKILCQAGLSIPDIRQNYEQYSLCLLEENWLYQDDISEYTQTEIIMLERFSYHGRKNPEGALWHAVSPEALKSMLAQYPNNINLKDSSGWTALHYITACTYNDRYFRREEMIKILLEAGADINSRSKDKITPFMLALSTSQHNRANIKILALLAKYYADPELKDKYNHDKYFWAGIDPAYDVNPAYHSIIEEITALRLSENEINMLVSLHTGDNKVLKKILSADKNINVNIQVYGGYTPLIFAAYKNNFEAVKLLLSRGALPNTQNERGETALHEAVSFSKDSKKILKILLSNGADPTIKDNNGFTAFNELFFDASFHGFFSRGAVEIIKLMLDHGVNPDSPESDGTTPLMNCACMTSLDSENERMLLSAMKILIAAGADVNAKDDEGSTPIIYASTERHRDMSKIINLLLSNGADPFAKNQDNNNALDIFLSEDTDSERYEGYLKSLAAFIKTGIARDLKPETEYANNKDDDNSEEDILYLIQDKGDYYTREPFSYIISHVSTEKIIEEINNGFKLHLRDVHGLTMPEAALNARNIDIVKTCIANSGHCETFLLVKAMRKYDVEGVKLLIEAGITFNSFYPFIWHFVNNFIPENNSRAREFKARLDKGTEILKLLHDINPEIPTHDLDGQELSYTWVGRNFSDEADWDSEFLPLKYISRLRHAVSPLAVHEVLSSNPYLDVNDIVISDWRLNKITHDDFFENNNNYDNETLEDVTRELSMKFSPADFVTYDEDEDYDDKAVLKDIFDDKPVGRTILNIIIKNISEYFDPAGIIQTLCKFGADVNIKNFDGSAALTAMLEEIESNLPEYKKFSSQNLEAVCELVRAGSDLDIMNEHRISFKKFIDHEYYINNEKFKDEVCSSGVFLKELFFIDILRSFTFSEFSKNSELLIASFGDDPDKIIDALSNGADINAQTEKGYSPVMIASLFGTSETIKLLLDNGANINDIDNFGNNLIALAVISNDDDYENFCSKIQTLVNSGANINSQNSDGMTPLMQAVIIKRFNHKLDLDTVKTLLDKGADLNIKSHNNECALTLAAQNGKLRLVKMLLLNGADPNLLVRN